MNVTDVQCRYCRATNDAEEHRCTRCGRRLHLASPQASAGLSSFASSLASLSMTATAAAPELEILPDLECPPTLKSLPGGAPQPAAEPDPRERFSYQPSLFREGPGAPKVIPIPTLTPAQPHSRESHSIRRGHTRSAPRPRRAPDFQQALDFHEAEEAVDNFDAQEDLIYCDAPVALPVHRLLATAVDASMVLIGLGIFTVLLIFMLGGNLAINRQTAPFLIAVGAVIALFYRSLWYFGNGDTPGMRFAGLRLVDFDGRRPDREQRGIRQVMGLLSLLSAGLGLVWALVDEEKLTWHDHISKTFPTPDRAD
jgi:uncharacterized RDD family membrane protein YckC